MIIFNLLTLSALIYQTSFLFGLGPLLALFVFNNFIKEINSKIKTLENVIIILRHTKAFKILF